MDTNSVGPVALGKSGYMVSRVIVGCASFGGMGSARHTWGRYGLDRHQAFDLLDAAVAFGVTTLDTASTYAGGESERTVGAWLSNREDRATPMVVSTKVSGSTDPDRSADLSPQYILSEVPKSLERLGLDKVDLLLSHVPDQATPIGTTLEAFESLIEAGTVGAIGACNIDVDQLRAALDEAERLGLRGYTWVQNGFNMIERNDLTDVLPLCRDRGIGYTPHSPLSGGILTGKYTIGAAPPEGSRVAARPNDYADEMEPEVLRGVQRLGEEASQRGVSTAALALAWVLNSEGVTAPIVAPRTPQQFDAVRDALAIQLDQEQRDQLTRLMVAPTPSPS